MSYIEILGTRITVTNLQHACQTIEDWISQRRKSYVCIAPVSTIVDGRKNEEYRRIVNGAGMVTPDGMPLVWIGKWKGKTNIERTYGPDLMLAFSEVGERKGYKFYFYGGTSTTNELLVANLKNRFPRLQIVGSYAPPFRDCGQKEDQGILDQINKADPDILWIGLGSPKQDYWMRDHREKLNVPVMVGAGAAFDFLAGAKAQAPVWMRRSGLEWLFRFCCEPRRLWRRYLIGNSQFIYFLAKDFVKKRLLGHL